MKKALLLMVILGLVVGCAHLEKEAIQKGYVRENPEYSYTLEVVGRCSSNNGGYWIRSYHILF